LWLVAGCLFFSIVRKPLQVFLLKIAEKTGPAVGDLLVRRLRQGRRGKRGSSRR